MRSGWVLFAPNGTYRDGLVPVDLWDEPAALVEPTQLVEVVAS
jgi:hypothetical protein